MSRMRPVRRLVRAIELPLRGGTRVRGQEWLGQVPAFLVRQFALEVERRRLFLWLPVAFGAGIVLYFAADREPDLWAPVLVLSICLVAAACTRAKAVVPRVLLAAATVFAGFAAASLRTAAVSAPVLDRLRTGPLTGFVETVEERAGGARLTIAPSSFEKLEASALPARVRVTTRGPTTVKAGDFIEATARLMPPPETARPGGYDFARAAFFQGIGAVGSIAGSLKLKAPPQPVPWRLRLAAWIDEGRNVLTRRIVSAFGGQPAAVAAALVTGKRGQIDETTNDALRAAGIYHIVSISGLHMVLAAGVFFWLARAGLCLSREAALGWPVKKIAAAVAAVGAIAYCVFSGSEVATERSLVMTLVILGAILVERPALSMRNLAIAALLVLAMEPESLLGPSFQMSFAAVAGLIAFCEQPASKADVPPPQGLLGRSLYQTRRAAFGVVWTTAVATLATAPFSAFHFQTLNPLGILGNAFSLPFLSFVIMPSAVAGVLLYPFGLDTPVWWLMGFATQPMLWGAAAIGRLDHASVGLVAFGSLGLAVLVLALLWATLWSSALRWLAVLPAAIGLGLAYAPSRPDVVVDRSGTGAAVRGEDGRLMLVGKVSSFVAEQWLRADGDQRRFGDPALQANVDCDRLGCVAPLGEGRALALVLDKRAFPEDCRRAAIVVSRLPAPEACKAPLVIDRRALEKNGAVAVNFAEGAPVLAAARAPGIVRPWLRQPRPERAVIPEAATPAPGSGPNRPSGEAEASDGPDQGTLEEPAFTPQ